MFSVYGKIHKSSRGSTVDFTLMFLLSNDIVYNENARFNGNFNLENEEIAAMEEKHCWVMGL